VEGDGGLGAGAEGGRQRGGRAGTRSDREGEPAGRFRARPDGVKAEQALDNPRHGFQTISASTAT
jgi:hypothetical protein